MQTPKWILKFEEWLAINNISKKDLTKTYHSLILLLHYHQKNCNTKLHPKTKHKIMQLTENFIKYTDF